MSHLDSNEASAYLRINCNVLILSGIVRKEVLTSSLGGYCSTVQGSLDWFEVDSGFTGEVGGWGRVPFPRI